MYCNLVFYQFDLWLNKLVFVFGRYQTNCSRLRVLRTVGRNICTVINGVLISNQCHWHYAAYKTETEKEN